MDQKEKLSGLTVALHWLVGLSIIGMLVMGIYMHNNEVWAWYPLHKSLGVLVLVFVLIRVVWRLKNGWLPPAAEATPAATKLAKTVQGLLLLLTLTLPLSGMIGSGMGGYGVPFFGVDLIPMNFSETEPDKIVAHSEATMEVASAVHELGALALIILIIIHLLAALKHHFIGKNGTLLRMLGKRIK